MRSVKFPITLLVLLALMAPAVAAGGFENFGLGAKAQGMGGAFRAIADHWTAAYYNPAGYAFINDNQYGVNLSVFHPRNEIVPYFRWDGTYETGIFNGQTNYNDHEVLSTPGGGFVLRTPFWGETVVGFSIYEPFDYNLSWKLFDLLEAYNSNQSVPTDQFRSDLDVVAFQFTAAREFIPEKLSIGIGLELLRGDLLFTNILLPANPMSSPYNDRPFDRIPNYSDNDGHGWGFGLRAGMMLKLNEKLSAALTAHLPFDMTIKGETHQIFYMPQLTNIDFSEGTTGYHFTAGGKIDYDADMEVDLPLPTSIAIGLSYDVTDKFTVAVDAEHTIWSDFESLEFIYSNPLGLGSLDTSQFATDFFYQDMTIVTDWKNSSKVMLGLSYDFAGYVTFLAGGSLDQSPMRSNPLVTPQFMDLGDKTTLSGGTIWHINNWDVGIVQSYTKSPDLTLFDLQDVNGDGLVDNFAGDYKATNYETVLSVNYRF